MNKYTELKEKHQKEVNDFPMMFAFSDQQFEEGMKKLGVIDEKELVSIGSGGFVRKTDARAYIELLKRVHDEHDEMMKDPEYCYEAFKYELANMEYCITYDYTDTLDALSLTEDEVMENPVWFEALKRAERDYLKECD